MTIAAGDGRRRGARQGLRRLRRRQAREPREVLLPIEVHRGGVVPPALVLVLDEHLVDAEIPVEIHRLPPRPAARGWRKITEAASGGQFYLPAGKAARRAQPGARPARAAPERAPGEPVSRTRPARRHCTV